MTECLSSPDERDAIQKKTFTKWINNHLRKAGGKVTDLFQDLRDGQSLLTLLELLSNEKLVSSLIAKTPIYHGIIVTKTFPPTAARERQNAFPHAAKCGHGFGVSQAKECQAGQHPSR